MIIHNYQSSSGKDLILEYIKSLPEEEKVDGFSVLESLENDRRDIIKYKCWRKKIYEVRFFKHNRIFFIVADKKNLYILHVCRKQTKKTEKKDSKIIMKRAKELGKMLGKKFIWLYNNTKDILIKKNSIYVKYPTVSNYILTVETFYIFT